MKIILLQEVANLGKPGEVKEVANGYARNYLLPRQLATPATAAQLASLRDKITAAQRQADKQRQEHEALATRLAATTLTFAVRVGRGDRLYGSVTNQDIANALREQEGITLDRRTILLREPLRQLGEFEVLVRVAPHVEPRIKVTLVSGESVSGESVSAPAEAEASAAATAAHAGEE